MAQIATTDPIASLNSILDLFNGKTSTSTTGPASTSTTSNITGDQLNAIISNAMAPVNAEQHTAGLYGSTPLAIARGQIAAETAAKYAGTTTTKTGDTTTNATPGILAPGRASTTLGGLLGAQLVGSAYKKGSSLVDSLLNGTTSVGGGPAGSSLLGTGGAGDTAGTIADNISPSIDAASVTPTDVVGSILGGSSADAATNLGAGLQDPSMVDAGGGGGSFLDNLSDLFSFADGGSVDTSSNPFVDSLRAPIDPAVAGNATPTISPTGATDPNPKTPGVTGSNTRNPILTAAGVSSNAPSDTASVGGNGGSNSGTLGGNIGSALGGMLGIVGTAMGHSPLGFAINALSTISNAMSTQDTGTIGPSDNSGTEADAAAASAEGVGTIGGADGSGTSGSDEATGGSISGPGTGTSDSIPSNLSNGEYVIDAKTTAALGPEFFQQLQARFNPAAIAGQKAKGRM